MTVPDLHSTKPSIYPPYCFNAAPTYNVSSLLGAADFSSLKWYTNIRGIHFHRNLPIRWARIVGVIVAIDDYPDRRVYTIDDSTGPNVSCSLPLEPRPENTRSVLAPTPPVPAEYSELDVGHVVDLRGPIIPYSRQNAIGIRRMKRVPTTQQEILLWEKRLLFKTSVLDAPWVLSDKEIRKYRKEAERADVKDFSLAAGKRKRRPRREDVHGPAEKDNDPFKIGRRIAKPSAQPAGKLNRQIRGSPCGVQNIPREESLSATLIPEADSQSRGIDEDPYSIKAGRSKRPAVSTASKVSSNNRLGSQDDPFKITKKSSTRCLKPTIQSCDLIPAHALETSKPPVRGRVDTTGPSQSRSTPMAEIRDSTPSEVVSTSAQATELSSNPHGRPLTEKYNPVTKAEPVELVEREQSAPAQSRKTHRATHRDFTDDPYQIVPKHSRRLAASPAALDQNTYVDHFRITKSAKGPRIEKRLNAEHRRPSDAVDPFSLGNHPTSSQELGGASRIRKDASDLFKIGKRRRN